MQAIEELSLGRGFRVQVDPKDLEQAGETAVRELAKAEITLRLQSLHEALHTLGAALEQSNHMAVDGAGRYLLVPNDKWTPEETSLLEELERRIATLDRQIYL